MSVVFETQVTQKGVMVDELMKEHALVLFDENAPKELHEISVLHSGKKVNQEVQPGDVLVIDGHEFEIYFVGDRANESLKDLGHVTFKFDGSKEDMPGSICIEPKEMPEIQSGTQIQIIRK